MKRLVLALAIVLAAAGCVANEEPPKAQPHHWRVCTESSHVDTKGDLFIDDAYHCEEGTEP